MEKYLPENLLNVSEIIKHNPSIKEIAKFCNEKEFIPIRFSIVSQPQTHPDISIYGRFVIVKQNVIDNLKNKNKNPKPEIKQDFIAYNRVTGEAVYYSGGSKESVSQHKSIDSFCKEYGKKQDGSMGQYECYICPGSSKVVRYKTKHHWYNDENDKELPKEQIFRNEIAEVIKKFRAEFSAKNV